LIIVARKFTAEETSTFYPPRARWYSPFFYLGHTVRRRLALDRLKLPREMKIGPLAAGFLVPGLAVHFRDRRLWGPLAMSACAALLLLYVLFLGYSAANIAFGLLMSIHATGFIYYCNPLMASERFPARLGFTGLVLLSMILLLYWPARNFFQDRWLMPLRLNGHAIIVQRSFQPQRIQRDEWVAYTFDANRTGNDYHGGVVVLRNGITLGQVLAVPGDAVTFSTNGFSVNGVLHTNLPHMPMTGGMIVPEKHWFIWPNLGISGYGDVGEARVSSAVMGLAQVAQEDFFGKPMHRWFWRKQTLP
jgi:hypothetical protein